MHRNLEPLDYTLRPSVARYIGGKRGFIDGALPPFGLVAMNAIAGGFMTRSDALKAAVATAVGTGLAIVAIRVFRREPLQQAGLLAASKLLLGWPLTLVALVLTLAYIRRATPTAEGSAA